MRQRGAKSFSPGETSCRLVTNGRSWRVCCEGWRLSLIEPTYFRTHLYGWVSTGTIAPLSRRVLTPLQAVDCATRVCSAISRVVIGSSLRSRTFPTSAVDGARLLLILSSSAGRDTGRNPLSFGGHVTVADSSALQFKKDMLEGMVKLNHLILSCDTTLNRLTAFI